MIKPRTKWKTIYPTFKDDERYQDILGQSGSNPLELFWDVVDKLDQELDAKISVVNNALRARAGDAQPVSVNAETRLEDFLNAVQGDAEVTKMSKAELETVFKTV
jgi:pre-mRNA-processing factor 40